MLTVLSARNKSNIKSKKLSTTAISLMIDLSPLDIILSFMMDLSN